MKGFTLIELLIAVAIIGILSAVAVPIYRDYIRVATEKTAQDGLHTIYVAQLEYFSDNNAYYSTGAACADATADINTNLFNGTNVLDATDFTYCILQTTTSDFTAQANEVGGSTQFTIDETRAVNF